MAAFAPVQTQNAVANGDTRTISLYHTHSKESITATFRANGSYDYSQLEKLNYFLRDWRNNDATKMDPRLFDVVWETYRESGSREPIHIVSAYRSPETNAMLRRRSSAVAEYSQHMLGKAMDIHYTDVPMSRIREIGVRLQRGGVGYYPTSGSPFVHLDVGSVRAWPRMTYDQLARIFPDGKTVHLAANGQTLGRYDEARNTIQSRNGVSVPTIAQTQSKGFFATLFGGGEDSPTAAAAPARGAARTAVAANTRNRRTAPQTTPTLVAQNTTPGDDTPSAFFMADARRSNEPASAAVAARTRLTRPTPAAPEAAAPPAPVLVAKLETRPEPARPEPPRPEPAKPTPAPEPPVRPAAVQEEIPVRAGATPPSGPSAPLPPRRPSDLASTTNLVAALNVPLPPSRPSDLPRGAPADDASRRIARADLPATIVSGPKSGSTASVVGASLAGGSIAGALAFAPASRSLADLAPKPQPQASSQASSSPARQAAPTRTAAVASTPVIAQPIGLRAAILAPRQHNAVASRLDRSNFRQLTAPQEIALLPVTIVAPAAPALRAATRSGLRESIFAASPNVVTRFEPASASKIPAPGFVGAAVQPLQRLETASVNGGPRLN